MARLTIEQDKARCQAMSAVHLAKKRGLLVPKTECELCGDTGLIHAHHYLGYERENFLDVMWLCPACHAKQDKIERDRQKKILDFP
jgi:Zn finger protein HypA/HybF involved in hydrogenase expression